MRQNTQVREEEREKTTLQLVGPKSATKSQAGGGWVPKKASHDAYKAENAPGKCHAALKPWLELANLVAPALESEGAEPDEMLDRSSQYERALAFVKSEPNTDEFPADEIREWFFDESPDRERAYKQLTHLARTVAQNLLYWGGLGCEDDAVLDCPPLYPTRLDRDGRTVAGGLDPYHQKFVPLILTVDSNRIRQCEFKRPSRPESQCGRIFYALRAKPGSAYNSKVCSQCNHLRREHAYLQREQERIDRAWALYQRDRNTAVSKLAEELEVSNSKARTETSEDRIIHKARQYLERARKRYEQSPRQQLKPVPPPASGGP